jgi:hypothetical protein
MNATDAACFSESGLNPFGGACSARIASSSLSEGQGKSSIARSRRTASFALA